MSLELKIEELTAAVRTLITVMQSGPAATFGDAAGAAAGAADQATAAVAAAKRTRRTKEQIAADEAAKGAGAGFADGVNHTHDLVTGDPEGTVYWLIAKHNTVYAQKPGDAEVSVEGAVRVGAIEFIAKKAEFEGKAQSAAAQTGATTTSTASSEKPADVPASGASFKQVVDGLMAINASDKAGLGTPALKAFLAKHGVERVPALEALKKNDDLLAEINALLTPAAATDDNLFG